MPLWIATALSVLVLWGLWGFLAKLSLNYLGPRSAFLYQEVGALLVALGVLASLGFRPEFHPRGAGLAVLANLVGGIGGVVVLYALSRGKVSVVVPLTALYPAVSVLLGVLVLREVLTWKQALGIVFGALALLFFSL